MSVITASITLLQTLVTAIGAGLGVWGIMNLLEGYGQDNPASKSQGIKQLMAGGGIILIATQLVPQLATVFGTAGGGGGGTQVFAMAFHNAFNTLMPVATQLATNLAMVA